MVDVYCPLMVIFQWGPDHYIIEAIVVQIWSACHGVAETRVLDLAIRVQSAVRGYQDL